jgi:hypothetical protein
MQNTIFLKALGLQTSPNPLSLEPGALIQASNVIIKRDNVIEPRRGFTLYGTPVGVQGDVVDQIMEYQGRILRHYNTFLQYDTQVENSSGQSIFNTFCGSYSEAQNGLRIKSVEQNGNFYFTTANGVQKISASSPDQFTTECGFITPAGGIDGISFTAQLNTNIPDGFLPADSTVAYRVVWGTNDANNNLVLGAPSERVQVYNPAISPLLVTFADVLLALDNVNQGSSLINDGNYVATFLLPNTASATQLYNNLLGLSAQIDSDILLANTTSGAPLLISKVFIVNGICTITFNLDPTPYIGEGQSVNLTGFTPTTGTLNGIQMVTVVDSGSKSISFTPATTTPSGVAVTAPVQTLADTSGKFPLTIDVVTTPPAISGGALTITFSAGNPGSYVTAGNYIDLQGFIPATGTLDGVQMIASVTTTTITIATAATGPVLVSTPVIYNQVPSVGPTVTSGLFEAITPPAAPASPATAADLVNLETYLTSIITTLQSLVLFPSIVPTPLVQQFFDPLIFNGDADVTLTINIPAGITQNYFLQIYRSDVLQATGTTVLSTQVASDEMALVYEAVPTTAQLSAGTMVVTDNTPDAFKGADLYTNAFSGQGILQANEAPPFALDVNVYKNYTFYANTRTKQTLASLQLLGVSAFKAGLITSISVANPTVITSNGHGLSTGDIVWIDNTNSTPAISGLYSVTVTGANTFTVPVNVTVSGSAGYWSNALITVNQGSTNTLYKLVPGVNQVISVTALAANNGVYSPGTLGGKYFTVYNAQNSIQYYFWYQTGSDTDPMVSGATGVPIYIGSSDSAATVAAKSVNTISTLVNDFTSVVTSGATFTISNTGPGYTNAPGVGTSQFTISTILSGLGQKASKQEVLLSTSQSPATAIDQTAQSLINVINENPLGGVYGYYLSQASTVPGQMEFQEITLSTTPFYFLANNSNTGSEFSPNISPYPNETLTNTVAAATVVDAPAHGLVSGNQVLIEFSNSTPSIDGVWTVNVIDANHFSLPVTVTIAGTTGAMSPLSSTSNLTAVSTNENRPNRLYYSKLQQPEAVPLVNFFDVGQQNKAILRIFPLRDSLFIFKEDGLYVLSGQVSSSFVLDLFDSSTVMIAADSVGLINNTIYCWTTQGISLVSESGVSLLSRPIDSNILPLTNATYPNFSTATFGVGYQSDNSYYVWTVSKPSDVYATICYRYSNLTSTWTTYSKTNTCGLVNPIDDILYLGAGDVDFVEQERKTFTRTDYADREIDLTLEPMSYQGNTLLFADVSQVSAGDVLVQNQLLTISWFNSFLQSMDNDPGIWPLVVTSITTGSTPTVTTSTAHGILNGQYVILKNTNTVPNIDGVYKVSAVSSHTFVITSTLPVLIAGTSASAKYSYAYDLSAEPGDNLRTDLVALATQMDLDPGLQDNTWTSSIAAIGPGTITDISATNPTVITSAAHGLETGRYVIISSTDSVPVIDGQYQVTVIDANTFSIPVSVQVEGTTGFFSTLNNSFTDIQACFNIIVNQLILNPYALLKNYQPSTGTTSEETIIESVNYTLKRFTTELTLPYIQGPMIVYEAINASYTYSPVTMGDTVNFKHLTESTIMFTNKAFTSAVMNFASDLLPQYISVPINGDGNGIFGSQNFGGGFFGGASNGAPFRTIVPLQSQRCRYLLIQFQHNVARETFGVLGASVTGTNTQSSRAYRS